MRNEINSSLKIFLQKYFYTNKLNTYNEFNCHRNLCELAHAFREPTVLNSILGRDRWTFVSGFGVFMNVLWHPREEEILVGLANVCETLLLFQK